MFRSGKVRPERVRGKTMRVPAARQWITDFLSFAHKVPSIPVVRRIDIQPAVAEREKLANRPSWVAMFAKAYSLVAQEIPQLRQAYLGNLCPRLYEHPISVASIAVEREYEGQSSIMPGRLFAPENQSLTNLSAELHRFKTADIRSISAFRELIRLSRLPRPMRRGAWWFGLNVSGAWRARMFGTFCLSVYANRGAESWHPISPLTTLLNYGLISPAGAVDVRVVYDHRVMDGSTVARALVRLEEVMRTAIVADLRGLRESLQAAA